jgi:hypothetical protein
MQDKKKKTNIKLNDLKPKKDAKGGVTRSNISVGSQSVNRPSPTIVVNGRI